MTNVLAVVVFNRLLVKRTVNTKNFISGERILLWDPCDLKYFMPPKQVQH